MYYARQPNVSRLNKLKKELILEVLIYKQFCKL